jgi:cytochrome oxidase Cu insertion factor (SCO1/SenC/PrrC family)
MKLNILLFFGFLAVLNFGIYAQNAKSKTEPLTVGKTAPDFTLSDQNGKQVTLSKAKKPVVLVFYRGYW